ncbi:MAG: hypothetical protein V4662_01855 [Verrucomicrobiota bacterium]
MISFGTIEVPPHPLRFGFQIDIVPEECPKQVMFGLVSRHRSADDKICSVGFAIQFDLQTGEVWDLLNDSGLLGILPDREAFLEQFSDEEPMLLSWEVEHLGSALIPKLHIGGEEWLYPAIGFRDGMRMETLAGGAGDHGSTLTSFMHPAVWRETMM